MTKKDLINKLINRDLDYFYGVRISKFKIENGMKIGYHYDYMFNKAKCEVLLQPWISGKEVQFFNNKECTMYDLIKRINEIDMKDESINIKVELISGFENITE